MTDEINRLVKQSRNSHIGTDTIIRARDMIGNICSAYTFVRRKEIALIWFAH